MISGAARTAGCENHMGFAAQYLSIFSPGRNFSPTRTVGGITTCEGMTLSHALTKENHPVSLFNSKYYLPNFQILLYYNHIYDCITIKISISVHTTHTYYSLLYGTMSPEALVVKNAAVWELKRSCSPTSTTPPPVSIL
jgi:hypothetical protein